MGSHTILGAGGVVADEPAKLLVGEKASVRLVSRSGLGLPGTEAFCSDVMVLDQSQFSGESNRKSQGGGEGEARRRK